jgi:putative ABC transport system permease protein
MPGHVLRRKLLRDLWGRKGSLSALLAIVAVGVGCFVGMAAVYRDLDGARGRYYGDFRLADFSVDFKRAPKWAVQDVAGLPNVRQVRGRINISAMIDLPGRDEPISGTAISMPSERRPVLNDILMRSGLYFSGEEDREVILNEAFARENGLVPGSRIKVLMLDKQHDLLVVGTAMSPEFVYLIPPGAAGMAPDPERFGVLYLPEDFLAKSCGLEGAYNQLIGLAHNVARPGLDNTLSLIEERLDPYGVVAAAPTVEQASARFLADELKGLKVGSYIIPAIFLGVAALVLNVLMARIVALQRPIIGTLRALGYSAASVMRHYLAFGVTIGALGGLCGVALGAWLQQIYLGLYRQFFALPIIDAHVYFDILAGGVGISVVFAALGTIKGVRAAARLEPAEAMRPPPPEKSGKILPERIPALWRPLPFRWKMILRSVFRNPFRSAVCVLASFISTSLIVSALGLNDSMIYLMDYEFEQVSHQDLTVSLRDPQGRRAATELRNLPTISETEPQLGVACDITHGARRKRTGVTGLTRGNRLYTPLDGAGQPISIPEEGLILDKKLSQILDARPGDMLRLRPLIGQRRTVSAPVVGTAETFLGVSAYADIEYLSRLLGEDWAANVIHGRTFRGAEPSRFLAALKKRPFVIGLGERMRALTQMDEQFTEMMTASIAVLILFSGLIAFGSVLNAALVSLSERRRDVGTLRVLGYAPGQVARIFSGESLLLNALGIALGLAGGIGLAHLFAMAYNTELYRFPAIVYPSRLWQATALMAVFLGLAQLIVYRMIRVLDWLDVLKIKE